MDSLEADTKHSCCLLMASHNSQDGGCIYIKKQTKYLFGDFELYNLSKSRGLGGVVLTAYLGKVWTKIRRFGILYRINKWLERKLAIFLSREFLKTHSSSSLSRVICVSEDPVSLLVATMIKKDIPDIKIHFSMLDLPWSYKASEKYRQMLKAEFMEMYLSSVDSADFCTPSMKQIFVSKGFSGVSFVTYSAIDVVLNTKGPVIKKTDTGIGDKPSIVLAGGIRAANEITSFCDGLSALPEHGNKRVLVHLLGPNEFSHKSVKYFGFKSDLEMEELLQNYYLGLVAMSFAQSDTDLVVTSFPGKTWLYLVNGVTPIIYAPANSGVAELVKQLGLGIVISDIRDLEKALNSTRLCVIHEQSSNSFVRFQNSLQSDYEKFRQKLNIENERSI